VGGSGLSGVEWSEVAVLCLVVRLAE